jgi:hypothetical protein
MTQALHPLYGEYANDSAIAQAASQRPGIVVLPRFTLTNSGSNKLLTLNPDSDLGIWAWRSRWIKGIGSFLFTEDGDMAIASANPTTYPYQLFVARWVWGAGPLDVNGHPTGAFTPGMHAVYGFETGVAGDMDDSLIKTSILQPDANGRYGVVLGVLNHGVFSFSTATMLDLAMMGIKKLPIVGYFHKAGLVGTLVATKINWAGSDTQATGNAPTINTDGDIVIQQAGFYNLDGIVQQNGGGNITCSYTVKLNGVAIGPYGNSGGALYLFPYLYARYLNVGDVISVLYTTNAALGTDIFFRFTLA